MYVIPAPFAGTRIGQIPRAASPRKMTVITTHATPSQSLATEIFLIHVHSFGSGFCE
jgi:hypothetical protein